MIDLALTSLPSSVAGLQKAGEEKVTVVNPVGGQLIIHFTNDVPDAVNVVCMDMLGRVQMNSVIHPSQAMTELPCTLAPGIYYLRFTTDDKIIGQTMITKE